MYKKRYVLFFLLFTFFGHESVFCQIVTTSARNQLPQTLITNVLAGSGVVMSDGQFNWSSANISTDQRNFYHGSAFTNFPFLLVLL